MSDPHLEDRRQSDGKFGPGTTSETDIDLDGADGVSDLDRRAQALAAAGYVPATATSTPTPAATTRDISRWWGRSFVNAEYGHSAGDRLAMPDDYTPRKTFGRAVSGHRRTHRMRYSQVPDVDVRMPSKTSIKRFSAEHHNRTFDVPVSATVDGRNVTGWVRITKGADGRWDAQGVGFSNPADEQRIAETVSMTLEGQRAPIGRDNAAAVVAAHRAERTKTAHRSIQDHDVRSSWIERAGWQDGNAAERGMMVMKTRDYHRKDGGVTPGRTYGYHLDKSTYTEFVNSERPGATFNASIKGQATRVEVQQCEQCGLFTRTPHTSGCPSIRQTPRVAEDSNRENMRSVASMLLADRRKR